MESSVKKVKLKFNSLCVYRNLLEDHVIKKFYALISYIDSDLIDLNESIKLYSDFFYTLKRSNPTSTLKEYIEVKVIFDENPFSHLAEVYDFNDIEIVIKCAAKNDLDCLQFISEFSSSVVKSYLIENCNSSEYEADLINKLPSWDLNLSDKEAFYFNFQSVHQLLRSLDSINSWSEDIEQLSNFYKNNGSGIFARYKAFAWEYSTNFSGLRGVASPDPITLSDLVGYTLERSEVINNTLQFLNGFHANNMLLYGDRGTGKSSTVKAILNEYFTQGLRLIEVSKSHLVYFPEIIRSLKDRKQKFIVFVDDLAFEDNEENYTALKAALEGGIESKPGNVLIYATSNRRHLIKEKFSDRLGLQSANYEDEVRAADSIQEKLSLADRFGITVVFSSPDKYKYLEIVEGIAEKRGLDVDKDYMHREALKWEMWYNGRSPRTARQFIDWLEGQQNSEK